jgi:hypothetical protein
MKDKKNFAPVEEKPVLSSIGSESVSIGDSLSILGKKSENLMLNAQSSHKKNKFKFDNIDQINTDASILTRMAQLPALLSTISNYETICGEKLEKCTNSFFSISKLLPEYFG